jgi:hypothetical protein
VFEWKSEEVKKMRECLNGKLKSTDKEAQQKKK